MKRNAISWRSVFAAVMPGKVRELQSKWDEWNKSNVKPRWGSAHTDNDGAEESQEWRCRQITAEGAVPFTIPQAAIFPCQQS